MRNTLDDVAFVASLRLEIGRSFRTPANATHPEAYDGTYVSHPCEWHQLTSRGKVREGLFVAFINALSK